MTDRDDVLSRLDRLESSEQIRSLTARYALAADARDIDQLVSFFTTDTPVRPGVRGRDALKTAAEALLSQFTTTIHFVGNHVIDWSPDDPDRASGVVYCRAEHEFDDQWVIIPVAYRDRYQRIDGSWYFYSRLPQPWYAVDVLERPTGRDKMRVSFDGFLGSAPTLPAVWPTWDEFWSARSRPAPADPTSASGR